MASSKRSFSDMHKASDDSKPRPRPNKRHRFGAKPKNQTKDGSINALKKRVRTIERLFNKGSDVPGNTKVELERELAAHKATIMEITYRKKRSEMIKKYHMVRFFGASCLVPCFLRQTSLQASNSRCREARLFREANIHLFSFHIERQKAERLVKQLTKQLKTAESDEVKAQLHVAEVDVAYTRYFPLLEAYVSLYPKKDSAADKSTTPTAKAALDAERPPMWKEIEEALAQGPRALERMRDRNPDGDVVVLKADRESEEPAAKEPKAATTKNKAGATSYKKNARDTSRNTMPNDSDSDSDGFFEE